MGGRPSPDNAAPLPTAQEARPKQWQARQARPGSRALMCDGNAREPGRWRTLDVVGSSVAGDRALVNAQAGVRPQAAPVCTAEIHIRPGGRLHLEHSIPRCKHCHKADIRFPRWRVCMSTQVVMSRQHAARQWLSRQGRWLTADDCEADGVGAQVEGPGCGAGEQGCGACGCAQLRRPHRAHRASANAACHVDAKDVAMSFSVGTSATPPPADCGCVTRVCTLRGALR